MLARVDGPAIVLVARHQDDQRVGNDQNDGHDRSRPYHADRDDRREQEHDGERQRESVHVAAEHRESDHVGDGQGQAERRLDGDRGVYHGSRIAAVVEQRGSLSDGTPGAVAPREVAQHAAEHRTTERDPGALEATVARHRRIVPHRGVQDEQAAHHGKDHCRLRAGHRFVGVERGNPTVPQAPNPSGWSGGQDRSPRGCDQSVRGAPPEPRHTRANHGPSRCRFRHRRVGDPRAILAQLVART